MAENLAALILAAGAGTRLRPLTDILPKALCPVNNIALVDIAIQTVRRYTNAIAVNVHHHRERMEEHLRGRVHLSIEAERALGSAGAVGAVRDWLDGRDLLIVNADRYHPDDLHGLVGGWQRETARLLVVEDSARADFTAGRFAGASLLPWRHASALRPEPSGLRDLCWDPMLSEGHVEFVRSTEPFVDCATAAEYHHANMLASGGENVVGPGATVLGAIERCVLWPGTSVGRDERLVDAVRATDGLTVFVD